MPTRVRFAPSPTGFLTLGGARTALFNWLFTRHAGGEFLLRIEDTDKERSKPEYETDIREMLSWLGLSPDEEPIRQTERLDIYEAALMRLIDEHKAYWCFCTEEELEAAYQARLAQGLPPVYGGTCRSIPAAEAEARRAKGERAVVRFKMPEKVYGFDDLVRGHVEFNSALIGDVIIAKGPREPLYNFAAAIDDHETNITHVIRGEEHLSNTPKQIALAEALGFTPPRFAHLPLILGPDRKKLSKRFLTNALKDYRTEGYLPDALLNFMVLLGWHPTVDREVISRDDMVKEFTLERVQKAGAIFNPEKLEWLNAAYLKKISVDDLLLHLTEFLPTGKPPENREFLKRAVTLVRDRMKKLSEFTELAAFLFDLPEYPALLLAWKNGPLPATRETLAAALDVLSKIPAESFSKEAFEPLLMRLAEERGRGETLWPLRVALSGQEASPGPIDLIDALGKIESERRITRAMEKLEQATLL